MIFTSVKNPIVQFPLMNTRGLNFLFFCQPIKKENHLIYEGFYCIIHTEERLILHSISFYYLDEVIEMHRILNPDVMRINCAGPCEITSTRL